MTPTETNNEILDELIRQIREANARGDWDEAERLAAQLKPLQS